MVATYGNLHETNDQCSLGDHTDRLAYYASVNANRTDLGLHVLTDVVGNRDGHHRTGGVDARRHRQAGLQMR